MITKTTLTQPADEAEPWVLEFPELETINIGDPEIQRELIKWGLATGIPGGEFIANRSFRLVAGNSHE